MRTGGAAGRGRQGRQVPVLEGQMRTGGARTTSPCSGACGSEPVVERPSKQRESERPVAKRSAFVGESGDLRGVQA